MKDTLLSGVYAKLFLDSGCKFTYSSFPYEVVRELVTEENLEVFTANCGRKACRINTALACCAYADLHIVMT